jgi:hypothetical protein
MNVFVDFPSSNTEGTLIFLHITLKLWACMCVSVSEWMCERTCVSECECVKVHVCLCLCVCVCVCMDVYMYAVCMYVCIFKYIPILATRMVPEFKKLGASGNVFFQQDVTPCHTSKKIKKKILTGNKISCLDWTRKSPDCNPIQNLWAICKDRWNKVDCTTKEKIMCAVIRVWFHDPKIKETYK